jgi:hypothetical protein
MSARIGALPLLFRKTAGPPFKSACRLQLLSFLESLLQAANLGASGGQRGIGRLLRRVRNATIDRFNLLRAALRAEDSSGPMETYRQKG